MKNEVFSCFSLKEEKTLYVFFSGAIFKCEQMWKSTNTRSQETLNVESIVDPIRFLILLYLIQAFEENNH